MALKNRSTLKGEFSAGNQATEEKFGNLIDSSYNKQDDSVLMGPVGITGSYGLLGPTGGTYRGLLGPSGSTSVYGLLGPTGSTSYYGLFISQGSTPAGPTAPGTLGEVFISLGASPAMYVYNGTYWVKFAGSTSW